MKSTVITISWLFSLALAQSQAPLYGQCGGFSWTGATQCVSGAVCHYYNEYYSQCIPGTDSSSSAAVSSTTRTTLQTTTRTATATTRPTSTAFPSISGTKFVIDGETRYFAGSNCYWCSFLPLQSDAELVISHLAESGLKILRIWGFNDVNTKPTDGTVWFQYLSSSGSEINTGSTGLQRLDWIVNAAENHGIKLIINFVNNWNDYGGIAAYTNAFGGDHAGWYTNEQAQSQYKTYIKAVMDRYINSSAILAWELANEPRCQGCDTSVIFNWATEISQYIKSIDSAHLVCLGDEGFGLPGDGSYPYTYYEGVDWEKMLTIKTLDFATFHLYPTSWSVSTDWGNDWIKAHAALCVEAGVPCLFEEYGMTYDQCAIESGWQKTSLAANGMAADLFWQLGDTISTGQSHNDGNTIYFGSDTWQCLVTDHVAEIPS